MGRNGNGKKTLADTVQEACEGFCQPIIELRSQVEKLKVDLEDRKKIEKAKWILIKTNGYDEDEAHRMLINHSRASRKKVVELAEAIIMGERLLNQSKLLIVP